MWYQVWIHHTARVVPWISYLLARYVAIANNMTLSNVVALVQIASASKEEIEAAKHSHELRGLLIEQKMTTGNQIFRKALKQMKADFKESGIVHKFGLWMEEMGESRTPIVQFSRDQKDERKVRMKLSLFSKLVIAGSMKGMSLAAEQALIVTTWACIKNRAINQG